MSINKEKSKSKSLIKTISIIIVSFITLPILIASIMYFTNKDFKDSSNQFLSTLPGNIGGYFQSIPTQSEKEQIKKDIAKHYINLDVERIVDKLLIVKGEDEELYNDLIMLMSRENSGKMNKVKENLRLSNLRNDPLNRILNEIDEENKEKISELQTYYTSLNLFEGIKEIERTYSNNEISIDEITNLFQNLDSSTAGEFLFYLDIELSRRIKFNLSDRSIKNIEKELEKIEINNQKLYDLSLSYENKTIEESVNELGNLDTYNLNELAFIFKNLSLSKSSEILSQVDDNEFMLTLLEEINHIQRLHNEDILISPLLTKGISVYREYNNKIIELASIYERTSTNNLVLILENMLDRNEIYKSHTLNDTEEIVFTEEELVVDVLKQLKTTKVAEILERMNENSKSNLSKKLLI